MSDNKTQIAFSKIWIGKPKERRPRRNAEKPKSRTLFTKRRKFVIVALLLSIGLFVIQTIPVDNRYVAIVVLAPCHICLVPGRYCVICGDQWFMVWYSRLV
jgi:hypothetical protein